MGGNVNRLGWSRFHDQKPIRIRPQQGKSHVVGDLIGEDKI